MNVRALALRTVAAVSLALPALSSAPATALPPNDVSLRITLAEFTGDIWIDKGRPGRAAVLEAWAPPSSCTITGLHINQPFVATCDFYFKTGPAALSSNCTGVWTHTSTLTFTSPITGQSFVIGYNPTVTHSDEGEGTGTGVNQLYLGHVNYAFASLCAVPGESDGAEGTLAGYATAN